MQACETHGSTLWLHFGPHTFEDLGRGSGKDYIHKIKIESETEPKKKILKMPNEL